MSRRPLLALGLHLARRGIMPVLAIGISALTVVALAILAFSLGAKGPNAPVHDVPIIASGALAWGGAFLLAFAAASHALRRDRTDGVRDLVSLRTTSLGGYLVTRVGGLAMLLALIVAGGTLLCGGASLLAAARIGAVPKTLQATFAGVVYGLAFAAVVAPVAFAALGTRSRFGGYLYLIGVVVIPELVAAVLEGVMPVQVTEVLAIPAALSALRAGLSPGSVDLFRVLRAMLALGVFTMIAVALVRREAIMVEKEVEP